MPASPCCTGDHQALFFLMLFISIRTVADARLLDFILLDFFGLESLFNTEMSLLSNCLFVRQIVCRTGAFSPSVWMIASRLSPVFR